MMDHQEPEHQMVHLSHRTLISIRPQWSRQQALWVTAISMGTVYDIQKQGKHSPVVSHSWVCVHTYVCVVRVASNH